MSDERDRSRGLQRDAGRATAGEQLQARDHRRIQGFGELQAGHHIGPGPTRVLYFNKMQQSRYKTIFWAWFVITCVVFLGSTFGLVYLVVDLRKDMSSVNNQLVSKTTRQLLQTASTEFVIQNGIMMQRPTAKQSSSDADSDRSDVKLILFSAPMSAISSMMTRKQLSTLSNCKYPTSRIAAQFC